MVPWCYPTNRRVQRLAIILPIAFFLLCWRAFRHRGDSSRIAILRAAILSATVLITSTEFLSIPYWITKTGLVAAWAIAVLAAIVFLVITLRSAPPAGRAEPRTAIHLPPHFNGLDALLSAAIALILGAVGLIAIVAPPNSWDVMEHHLPRVLFWVSNHTLRSFPTPDYTQIVLGTASETITLNTYLLWGSDRLANLVEFFSFIGAAIAASLIASRFGAQRTGQLLAVLFVVTIPEALLEASGSMNTGVAAFFTATSCCFLLKAGADPSRWDIVIAAMAAGLSLLTKGVTFVYVPFLLLGCMAFRPRAIRLWMLKRLPLFVAIILAINAGQFVRAYEVTGTPFNTPFPAGGPRLAFEAARVTPASIAANVLRQATLQTGIPSDKLNGRIESATRKAIAFLGQNPDDPGASWSGLPFSVDHPTRLETQAGNPVHFAIIVACCIALLFLKRWLKDSRIAWYAASIIVAFIAFSACIRWQSWGSRFHLTLFVMAAALVGVVAERLLTRRWQIVFFSTFLILVALPYVLSNSTRSILHTKGFPTIFEPRATLCFGDQHMAQAPVVLAMANAIRSSGCARIALDAYLPTPEPRIAMSPESFYIYPLLAQLGIDGRLHFVHYINVQNPTRSFAPRQPAPPDCAIVCLSCRLSKGQKSDAALGKTYIFGNDELVFPSTNP